MSEGSRIALPFVAIVALLATAIGATAVWLVGRTVEDRIHEQLTDTARLFSGHFPLSNETASRLARYIRAEIVVVGGTRILATSLAPEDGRAFERALEAGGFPLDKGEITVRERSVGSARRLVAAAPLETREHVLYLVYPPEVLSDERSRATRPVLIVSVVAVVLTALLGALKERAVVRERTEGLARLVSALAHEVKNPLGAIQLTVETIRDAVPGAREREAIDVVTAEVERLSLLVDELRLLGNRTRSFKPAAVLPREAVDSVLALLRRTFEHRGLRVVPPKDPALDTPVLVDPRALKQALLNLLLNAIEASPREGTIRLGVTKAARSGFLRFEVQDEGPGVPSSVRARLFHPFVSTKDGGTGLGLALARFVAQDHGGSLELVSSEGRGATFALELPVASTGGPS